MKIIQISDFHLRGDGKLSFQKADTKQALDQTVEFFCNLKSYDLPEYFVVTGDLAEGGMKEGYELLRQGLDQLPRPYYIVPGNHDKRDFFLEMFPEHAPVKEDIKPYICYTLDDGSIRSIIIDTCREGCHYGGLTDKVAEWLEGKIIEYPNKPTLVFTHHPPFITGLPAMDEEFAQADRLMEILKKHKNVRLCCGHMHTGMFTSWKGIPCVTCPSIAMQMEVDFRGKNSPDVTEVEAMDNFKGGGDRFFLGNPGYLIHDLQGNQINTHSMLIPTGASYSGPWPFKYYEGEED
ncbi:MAG: phosphodiesterase [Anaerostipes sp.]|nr:phosphodiesterase [Anaerostipes sp.]